MKGEKMLKILLVFVIVLVLASFEGGIYLLVTQQQQITGKKIEALKGDMDNLKITFKGLDSQIKNLDTQSKNYTGSFKNLEDKISAGDAERKDIASKVADLMKAVEDLKTGAAATSASSVTPTPAEPAAEPTAPITESAMPAAQPTPAEPAATQAVDLGEIPVQK